MMLLSKKKNEENTAPNKLPLINFPLKHTNKGYM